MRRALSHPEVSPATRPRNRGDLAPSPQTPAPPPAAPAVAVWVAAKQVVGVAEGMQQLDNHCFTLLGDTPKLQRISDQGREAGRHAVGMAPCCMATALSCDATLTQGAEPSTASCHRQERHSINNRSSLNSLPFGTCSLGTMMQNQVGGLSEGSVTELQLHAVTNMIAT